MLIHFRFFPVDVYLYDGDKLRFVDVFYSDNHEEILHSSCLGAVLRPRDVSATDIWCCARLQWSVGRPDVGQREKSAAHANCIYPGRRGWIVRQAQARLNCLGSDLVSFYFIGLFRFGV